MSIETEALLQEAKESIEAAQNYRTELQQRLHGLSQARKQVSPLHPHLHLHLRPPPPPSTPPPHRLPSDRNRSRYPKAGLRS